MRRKRFGRTNLEISELSLGTVELGLDYGISEGGETSRPSEEDACALLRFALDRGINLIDTARAYGDAERIIGRALRDRRGEYVIATKVMPTPSQRPAVSTQAEESLAALQTEQIDIMMIHCRADQVQPDLETYEQLDHLRKAGLICFIGASVYGPVAGLNMINSGLFDCVEVAFSMLDRRVEPELLKAAAVKDVGVVARSVLLRGALSPRYQLLPDALLSLKRAIARLAGVAGSASRLPELAYRYVAGREVPHTVLAGTASRCELDSCIGYLERGPLSAREMAAIQDVYLEDESLLNPGNWPSLAARI